MSVLSSVKAPIRVGLEAIRAAVGGETAQGSADFSVPSMVEQKRVHPEQRVGAP